MKLAPIILIVVLVCATAKAQDAHFEFRSPWGSDGTNQPNLDPQTRNYLVLDHIWDDYIRFRIEINKPLPKASPDGYSQAYTDYCMTILRYGSLLESMAELRAFTAQNTGYVDETQKAEIARIDQVLRAMKLHYSNKGGQAMVDFCAKVGSDKVRKSLAPVLCDDNGSPRPIPPIELGYHQIATGEQR